MRSATDGSFRGLGLHAEVLAAIEEDLKFDTPTPIQEKAIPIVANGHDLIAKAETGTGKTLAFCAPILGRLDPTRTAVQAIVLCPTRELAQQVAEVAEALGKRIGIESVLLVGGVHQSEQILKLRSGAQMVVGTPGRVLDFLGQGTLRLGWTTAAVLDEADRMLDMGFIDDVTNILKSMPQERQTLLFSATIPPRLKSLSKRFMRKPKMVSTVQGMATVPEIRQCFVQLHSGDKEGYILDLIDNNPDDTCIIFCNTRREVIELDRCLWGLGYDAGSLHGDHEQEQRFKVLEAFKERRIKTLVATDVAARGLDITEVARVVNYDVPDEVETYVHRIGRTGRAGGVGESVTLVTRQDRIEWDRIERTTGFDIEEITDWKPSRPRREQPADTRRRGSSARGRSGGGSRSSSRGRPGSPSRSGRASSERSRSEKGKRGRTSDRSRRSERSSERVRESERNSRDQRTERRRGRRDEERGRRPGRRDERRYERDALSNDERSASFAEPSTERERKERPPKETKRKRSRRGRGSGGERERGDDGGRSRGDEPRDSRQKEESDRRRRRERDQDRYRDKGDDKAEQTRDDRSKKRRSKKTSSKRSGSGDRPKGDGRRDEPADLPPPEDNFDSFAPPPGLNPYARGLSDRRRQRRPEEPKEEKPAGGDKPRRRRRRPH